MIKKLFSWAKAVAIFGLLVWLASCSGTIAVTYSPGSVMKGTGPVKVATFNYVPYEQGEVKANQVQNTAAGNFYTTKNIDKFITDAVIQELSFVGYSVEDTASKVINGRISQFLADDLGFSVDWLINITFEITGDEEMLYSNTFEARTKTSKGPGFVQGAVIEIVRDCIEEFIRDAQNRKVL
ncbi:MAG: hypothetical protein R6V25_08395 [Desulfatiglandales bacterium]